MPAVWSWKGTHAKGSCEPGQAGRCSHKQPYLVQWIRLFWRRPRAPFTNEIRNPKFEIRNKNEIRNSNGRILSLSPVRIWTEAEFHLLQDIQELTTGHGKAEASFNN